MINDVSVGSSFTDSRGNITSDSSTGFVVYDLKAGDKVRVKVNGTTAANALFSTFHEKNSFLLKQLAKEFCRYFYVRRLELQVKQEQCEEAKNPSINYRIIFTLSIKLI